MKTLLRPFKFIFSHPLTKNNKLLGLFNFFYWQLRSRLNSNEQTISWFDGLKLNVKRGMHGATGCIYVGLTEFEDMSFVLHYLNHDDLFIDIGANVGVYSLMAAGIRNSETISIEPVPSTFQNLTKNIKLNNLQQIQALNIGLSDENGHLYFTSDGDTNNHVTNTKNDNNIEVEVKKLDAVLDSKLDKHTIIKLDVEGFEIKVLKGASAILNNPLLDAVIVELNGCSNRYGFNDADVDDELTRFGFDKYEYNPFKRELIKIAQFHTEKNTLYIKRNNLPYVKEKIIKSEPYHIFNKSI
ncbi:MAG: FkbM family methyltransferase [Flavobacteriales bacterium]|nr:FkbM family methyltransferase [Flavobacteriales bacterium]MCB9499659.1 FkbM family methyltransferase [Erysipelotrichaceae bacterium]